MNIRAVPEIVFLFCLKIIGLCVLWFLFVHGHEFMPEAQEMSRHFLGGAVHKGKV